MLGFRIWDTEKKIFITDMEYLINLEGELVEFDGTARLIAHKYSKNLIPMQSTGIKDKNNVMIFEGDILLLAFSGVKHQQLLVVEDTVKFIQYECDCVECMGVESLTIIGNVYENSELLEKLK